MIIAVDPLRLLLEWLGQDARLAAGLIRRSFEPEPGPGNGDPSGRNAIREELAQAVALLVRHRDEVGLRIRELHGRPEPSPRDAVLGAIADDALAHSVEDVLHLLMRSVQLRVAWTEACEHTLDPHSRWLLRLQRALEESVLLPSLASAGGIAVGPPSALAAERVAALERHLLERKSSARRGPDTFLHLSTLHPSGTRRTGRE